MATATAEMQFKKHLNVYVWGDYTVYRGTPGYKAAGGWWQFELGKQYLGARKTLKDAKQACAEHARKQEEKRAELEREEQRKQRIADAREYSADLGCSWAQWAELRVGFTLAQLREDEQQLKASRAMQGAKDAIDDYSGYFDSASSQEQLKDVLRSLMRELSDPEAWLRDEVDNYQMRVVTADQVAAAEFNEKTLKQVWAAFEGFDDATEAQYEALEQVWEATRD